MSPMLRLFVLDVPAKLLNRLTETWRSSCPSSEDAFLLHPPPDATAKCKHGPTMVLGLQMLYGLLATLVMAIWLAVGLARSSHLVHTDWPFVAPDMFSRVGRWSSRSPFRDVLSDQFGRMVTQRP